MATPDYQIDEQKQTVQGQLDNLISQDNPLMQKAKSQGQQYANKRGLLNSSIGAGAAQSAMMDYAMPIAAADAQTNNQFASMNYGATLDKDRAEQAQGFTQSNMDLTQQYNMETLQKQDDLATQQLAKTTSANLQGKYTTAVDDIINNAMVSINKIEEAEGISAAEKTNMINNTITRRDKDLEFSRLLYSNMPTWDFSWIDFDDGGMPSAPGVGA